MVLHVVLILKAKILEAARTLHIQNEFSGCRCGMVCIWYYDNFITKGCSKHQIYEQFLILHYIISLFKVESKQHLISS